jgi:hypothetical protein
MLGGKLFHCHLASKWYTFRVSFTLYIKNFKMKGLFVVVVFVGLVGNSRKSNVLQMIMLSFP